ncbi:transposase, partial [Deinococcus apachensis]|uniref:transposase n=1 Tax=Deinococcus apachensis TaxID=309886 RepID=UPI000370EB24
PFFGYLPEIRRAVYTTNCVEALNFQLRKVTKTKGAFPSEDAALKVLYLAIQRASAKWSGPIKDWRSALNVFTIVFEGRLPAR